MKKAIFTAVIDPDSNSSTITPVCPTGNCTFPVWSRQSNPPLTHASLGICNECTDVSSLITIDSVDDDTQLPVYGLPNGMILEAREDFPYIRGQGSGNLTWAESQIPLEQASKLRYSVANVTVFTMTTGNSSLYFNDTLGRNNTPIAVSCSLYPCLRSYWAEVTDGKLREVPIDSQPLYPDVRSYEGSNSTDYELKAEDCDGPSEVYWTAIQSPCRVNDTIYTTENMSKVPSNLTKVRIISPDTAPDYPSALVPRACLFDVQCFIGSQFRALLSTELFSAEGYWTPRQGNDIWWDQWWLDPFWRNGTSSVKTVTNRFSGIADSMTNQLRKEDNPRPVLGTALQNVAYTSVRWQWLLFPTILLATETFLLAWVVGRSWRFRNEEVVWKSNLLALYYFKRHFARVDGLGSEPEREDDDSPDKPLLTVQEMAEDASRVMVKFVKPRKLYGAVDREESFMPGIDANDK